MDIIVPTEIKIFLAQFTLIFLLGFQSMNIKGSHKILAAFVSLLLGFVGFYITGTVAEAFKQGYFTTLFWSYAIAGPIGIVSSMSAHPKIVALMDRMSKK